MGCFGVIERQNSENLEKFYEIEIEDDKVFLEDGQNLYDVMMQ